MLAEYKIVMFDIIIIIIINIIRNLGFINLYLIKEYLTCVHGEERGETYFFIYIKHKLCFLLCRIKNVLPILRVMMGWMGKFQHRSPQMHPCF